MVFTPPPSPLPPRHPKLEEEPSNDAAMLTPPEKAEPMTNSTKADGPAVTASPSSANLSLSQSTSSGLARIRRRLLVFVVPAILLFVCSTSSFITQRHEEMHGALHSTGIDTDPRDNAVITWNKTISGHFRDPALPPAPTPHHHHGMSAFSKHIHGSRTYGFGRTRDSSSGRPTPTVDEPEDTAKEHDGIADTVVKERAVVPPTKLDGAIFPHALAAAALPTASNPINNLGQETAPPIPTPPWPVPTPFPQPFDSSLSYNFSTSTCLAFFTTQLANQTFRECRPFGLLFGTSADFFSIEGNLTELTATLGGTCNTTPTEDTCSGIMDWMAGQMLLDSVCRKDLSEQNTVALEALYGFRSYDLYRKAGCLVNPRTNAYCFAEALAQTSPSDLYYFALPLGTPIPGTTNGTSTTTGTTATTSSPAAAAPITTFAPSCSTCVSSLMAIFAPHASDPSLLLGLTYPPAANAANKQCGSGYAPGPESVVASPTPPVPLATHASSVHSTGGATSRTRIGTDGAVLMMMSGVMGFALVFATMWSTNTVLGL